MSTETETVVKEPKKNRSVKKTIMEFIRMNPGKTRDQIKEGVFAITGKSDNWYTGYLVKCLVRDKILKEENGGIYIA